MIQLLVTGITMSMVIGGCTLMALWARRRLAAIRPGGVDPRCLEVLARVGVHNNQGLAVVRVGRRHLLVSCGEGGARTLAELTEDDLGLDPVSEVVDTIGTRRSQTSRARRLWSRVGLPVAVVVGLSVLPGGAEAQSPPPPTQVAPQGSFAPIFEALPPVSFQVGDDEEGLRLDGTVGTVIVLGLLSLAPTLLLLTTSFTRILIVLHLLRQALGTQSTPPGHLLAGLALLLTAVVMAPTIDEVRVAAVDPWIAGEIDEGTMLRTAVEPIRYFMLAHTREADLTTFLRVSGSPPPLTPADVSNVVLMSAFVTSELKAAFEIGFALFLPFIVIDLVVAAVLTSMGMFMLPPTMIALPCKLMLFVLMDGWSLLLGTLAQSFL